MAETAVGSHHFLDDFSQGAPLDVLGDEVEPLVLVENANELEHIWVVKATHDLNLTRGRPYVDLSHL